MGCIGCSCSGGGCSTGVSLEEFLNKTFGDKEITSKENSEEDSSVFPIVEVLYLSQRTDFVRNPFGMKLVKGDAIIVQADGGGYDYCTVKSLGKSVKFKLEQKNLLIDSPEILSLIRKATSEDKLKYEKLQEGVPEVKKFTVSKIDDLKLDMKYVDTEIRFDGQKTTIFFTAEQRVDFRELVRVLAAQFKSRIQLTQISAREEAKRVGGIGSCGRTLCCSSWLPDFEHVSSEAAKYQNLPLNSTRLNGQCGRLKCCLNYELDTYMTQLQKFPPLESRVQTDKGYARVEKIDIFKDEVWLQDELDQSWQSLSLERFNKLFVKR